jgi:hypothetical protein
MMYLDNDLGIRVAEYVQDIIDSGETLRGGKDDKTFRLDRVGDRVYEGMKP